MTRREKILITSTTIFGLLALIFLLFIVYSRIYQHKDECTTRYCVEAAAQILEYVDLKEDPCKNFYKFACGSFYKNAVKKDSPSPWTSTGTLFKNEMKSIVVDSIKKKDMNAHVLLKQFYHECMNVTKIDKDDNHAFMDAINMLGGWPLINETWNSANFDWIDWFIEAKHTGLPVTGFFSFQNKKMASRKTTVLKVSGPHFKTLPYEYRYQKLMKRISSAFGATYNATDNANVHEFAERLYDFRNSKDPDTRDDGIEPEISTIQDLNQICPFVPWSRILNALSGGNLMFDGTSEVAFYVQNMRRYCLTLAKLLQTTDPKVIANFYVWSIIENAHSLMNKDIRRAYEDVNQETDERFKICYEAADERFKNVKETIYVRKKTVPKVKAQLIEMIEILKELYIEHLKDCDWMDEDTKNTAMKKATAIGNIIGAYDELYNIDEFDKFLGVDGFKFSSDNIFKMLQEKIIKEDDHVFANVNKPASMDWESFFSFACKVNAFFVQPINTMIIPAPILTSIFFNRKYPAFMNYGGLGRTIGHELMHGFSKSAHKVLMEDGSFYDWWSQTTRDRYDNKVECIIDEYEGIPFRYKLNGTATLEENVADYVGADIGYEAYQRYIKKHGIEKKIPGVPLLPEQIYWLQASASSCFRKLDDNTIDYEEEDDHAIPQFRVQAPARHSPHFAEAFNCPTGSVMNPEKKCRIL